MTDSMPLISSGFPVRADALCTLYLMSGAPNSIVAMGSSTVGASTINPGTDVGFGPCSLGGS